MGEESYFLESVCWWDQKHSSQRLSGVPRMLVDLVSSGLSAWHLQSIATYSNAAPKPLITAKRQIAFQ